MNNSCTFLKACFGSGVFNIPVTGKSLNPTEERIQRHLDKMEESFKRQIPTNPKSFDYTVKGSPDLARIMEVILRNDGCKGIKLENNKGWDSPWSYTPPSTTILVSNPNYEINLESLAYREFELIKEKLENLDRLVNYEMVDNLDLANQLKKILEKKGYQKVEIKRNEGWDFQSHYTPPSIIISFLNPNRKINIENLACRYLASIEQKLEESEN
ncbi:MAG: hypothetical protein JSS09_04050, partial [Verrucomicrobia bacterium]|nr:hypothetical protein [Verrucomicrobiota bacterium]